MSGTNDLMRPLGRGLPLPGGNTPAMPQPRGARPGSSVGGAPSAMPRGPTMNQMQNAVAQPSAGAISNPAIGGGIGMPPSSPEPMPRTVGGVGDLPDSFHDSRNTLAMAYTRNKSMYADIGQNLKKLDAIRKSLSDLQDKQDTVTMQDVVSEAGKLVTKGLDPMALAGVLADAPQEGGGEALGGWVASHAMQAATAEQQMIQQRNMARLNMAMSATHLMMAHANASKMTGRDDIPMGDLGNGMEESPNETPHDNDADNLGTAPANMQRMGQRFMNGGGNQLGGSQV